MEYIDALDFKSRELNQLIAEKLKSGQEVTILNPHSMHNIATGLSVQGKIIVRGSTGFYAGGFLEGPTLVVEGKCRLVCGRQHDGWGAFGDQEHRL